MADDMRLLLILCMFMVYKRQQQIKSYMEIAKIQNTILMTMMFFGCMKFQEMAIGSVLTVLPLVKKRRRIREYYIKPRSIHWFTRHFWFMDDMDFRRLFRFPRNLFEQLVRLYGADLLMTPPKGLKNLPNRNLHPGRVVAIALHRLASGGSDAVVGTSFGVSGTTVYIATERFVNAVLISHFACAFNI